MPNRRTPIAFVSAECTPFVKVGGLADVVGALPKALERGPWEPTVFVPLYGTLDRSALAPLEDLPACAVHFDGHEYPIRGYASVLPGSSVTIYFLEVGPLFDRPGIYVDPAAGEGYGDNEYRFMVFSRAVIEFWRALNYIPALAHVHDFHTALLPAYLRDVYWNDERLRTVKTVLTLHNLGHQGHATYDLFARSGFSPDAFYSGSWFEFHGNFNLLKTGICFADRLTTVSPTYAREILTPEGGMGLHELLAYRGSDLSGILNGIDHQEWDPAHDPLIPAHFTAGDRSGKTECKRALLEEFGWFDRPDLPLAGIVGRMTWQKGFDLVLDALPDLVREDLRLIVLGTGERRYEDAFRAARERFPDHLRVYVGFDNALAHRIEAGSDLFLMPSRYEPCGLNQLYSLRYGTIPIVHAVGGLADSVAEFDGTEGTGFTLHDDHPQALVAAVRRALGVFYADPPRWRRLVGNAMRADYGWDRSAADYAALYRALIRTES